MASRSRFDPRRAIELQRNLAPQVIRRDRVGRVRRLAGVDVSVVGDRGRAAVVVLGATDLEPLETRVEERTIRIPYIPGLLAFRELPVILGAFRKIRERPDLVVVDGMGLIHPRRFGIACHLGVVLGLPTIGCGKTPFVGAWEAPGPERGCWSPVVHSGERLGVALRTRDGVKPVFVSTGHRISLSTAIRWILRMSTDARLPQPIRLAHEAASLAGE